MNPLVLLLASRDVPVVFLVLFGIVAVAISIAVSSERTKRINEALEKLARRLGGRYTPAGFIDRPALEFMLLDRPTRMEFHRGSRNSPPRSRLEVTLKDRPPGTLHILPEGFGQSFLKLFGAQDITIGDAQFDSDYVIKATPESLAAQLFNPLRRSRVMASVRRLSSFQNPTIDLEYGRLSINVREFCTDEGRLLAMVQTAEDFLKYLFPVPGPAPEPGIQWGEVRVLEGGHCQVCGMPMKEGVVRCELCRTPHHEECWQYAGRCSMFGCAGRKPLR